MSDTNLTGESQPSSLSMLSATNPPFLHLIEITRPRAYEFAWSLADGRAVVRVLRGAKMKSFSSLCDEVAAVLQFPDYFGENWSALAECLRDLSWLPGSAYHLIVTDAEAVLDESVDLLASFLKILVASANYWARPIDESEPWGHGPVPFHVVFQASGGAALTVRARYREAGSDLALFRSENRH